MEKYSKLDQLGEGSYGVVYKAINKHNQKVVVLKEFYKNDEDKDKSLSVDVLRECNALKTYTHENIISVLDVVCCSTSNKIYLVLEYISYTLTNYIYSSQGNLSNNEIKLLLKQLLKVLLYFKQRGLLHRDLKPQNILIDVNNLKIKIIDFGLSREIKRKVRKADNNDMSPEIMTRWYKAPEVLLGLKAYDFSIDMWSVGCIFAEMITGTPIFQGESDLDQLHKIFKLLGMSTNTEWSKSPSYSLSFPKWTKDTELITKTFYDKIGHEGIDLLLKMLNYNPNDRISPENALLHSYLQ